MTPSARLAYRSAAWRKKARRGVSVWAKPMKFMASVALFAATTAWFVGLLPEARRRARPVRLIVWTLVIAGTLEVGYISLQAALGQPSHYNRADSVHKLLYMVMGLLAVSMMLTHPLLAWQIARRGHPPCSHSSSRTLNCPINCVCTLGGTGSWCDSATA